MLGDCILEVDEVAGDPIQMLGRLRLLVKARRSMRIRRRLRSKVNFDQELRLACLLHFQKRDLTQDDLEFLAMLDNCAISETAKEDSHGERDRMIKLLESLPSIPASACAADECAVCLTDFTPSSLVTRLPCRHCYCKQCITEWLTDHGGHCPMCLQPVVEQEIASFDPVFDADSDAARFDECIAVGPLPKAQVCASGDRSFGQSKFML
jgi:hypothetical protein